ncbi:MAG: peptidase M28, partial [Acidobacteria bacterium]
MRNCVRLALIFIVCISSFPAVAQQEKVDLEMVTRIRYEGFRNSKVMDLASGLMDGIGPRLTGSPNMRRGNEWTRDQLTSFGLANAHLES